VKSCPIWPRPHRLGNGIRVEQVSLQNFKSLLRLLLREKSRFKPLSGEA
jgi:hypothetical protein